MKNLYGMSDEDVKAYIEYVKNNGKIVKDIIVNLFESDHRTEILNSRKEDSITLNVVNGYEISINTDTLVLDKNNDTIISHFIYANNEPDMKQYPAWVRVNEFIELKLLKHLHDNNILTIDNFLPLNKLLIKKYNDYDYSNNGLIDSTLSFLTYLLRVNIDKCSFMELVIESKEFNNMFNELRLPDKEFDGFCNTVSDYIIMNRKLSR